MYANSGQNKPNANNKKKNRSSCSMMFSKIDFLKFRKFHKKAPVLESLFMKIAGLR